MDKSRSKYEYTLKKIENRIIKNSEKQKLINNITNLVFEICKKNENVYSVFTAGSLSRGDFILGVSDLDIFIVFKKERDEKEFLLMFRSKCQKDLKLYFANTSHENWSYDILSEFLPNIATVENPNPLNKTERGQLCFRAFDTKKCGKILYGEDILKDLIIENPKSIVIERIETLVKKYHQKEDTIWKIMHIGDIIKAVQIYFGKATYDKREVLKGFAKYVPDFQSKNFVFDFWDEYLESDYFTKNNKEKFMRKAEQFLIKLIEVVGQNTNNKLK